MQTTGDRDSAMPPSPGSTALIAALWIAVPGLNLLSFAQERTPAMCQAAVPAEVRLLLWIAPLLFMVIGALRTKQSPFLTPLLVRRIDDRFGADTLRAFLVRLRPLLLLSLAGLLSAGLLAWTCSQGGMAVVDWTTPGFLISGSVGLALAHVIQRRRGVPGV